MNKTKQFLVHYPDEIPPASENSAHIAHDFSDWFLAKAKAKAINGDIIVAVVGYDFKHKTWRSLITGTDNIIEYYTEIN